LVQFSKKAIATVTTIN